jgi:hypothetical protein
MRRASRGEDAVRERSRLLSTCRSRLRLGDAEACRECLHHKKTSEDLGTLSERGLLAADTWAATSGYPILRRVWGFEYVAKELADAALGLRARGDRLMTY